MTAPVPSHDTIRLIVLSYNGLCRRFDLDGNGRLSFAHLARVFRITIESPDDCDAWTLNDTSLRIDKSDPGALLTVSALRDLFPLPSGTTEHPLVLRTDDAEAPPSKNLRQPCKSTGTRTRPAHGRRTQAQNLTKTGEISALYWLPTGPNGRLTSFNYIALHFGHVRDPRLT
ncbi:hypothetical protein VOLCADRAFT_93537 [Volvox carteri f. nagariensis]|uniref:EF-hand domain-containing protein n=1 Tax=Volvox carteri f. nagariensis TaxID=3068 RepID=D8U2D7_VOLCA|nr:uncharacterized protein VOLCADRAFT_93537 [Volvox carteri f. nagariensis]EFJ46115.1 hypothetical protein VOLCADRAFT_93537 [Volvox carteri f. nagariensis]|eukprot:XP_002952865.1 hypothetical protein VOLCADRAFT_93537 [Volvox carteri f. nagariensis]